MPAARAGLYVIRITRGTVDDIGVQPALRQFDCLGGFSRGVADLAHLVAIMQKKDIKAYMPLPPRGAVSKSASAIPKSGESRLLQ